MAKGSNFIQAIGLLLDSELHTHQETRDDLVAQSIKGLVAPYDIDPRSRRLAGALKASRTTRPGKDLAEDEDIERENRIFTDRFPQLARLTAGELQTFISDLRSAISKFDMKLYGERTKLSTISTIIRPLSTKWLERWRIQRADSFDYDKSVYQVAQMLNREIESESAYFEWMEDIYELFLELVIFRSRSVSNQIDIPASKPLGMVSESNERIYRRNWTEFRDLMSRRLIDRAEEIAGGRFDSSYNSSYRPQLKASDYVSSYEQSSGFNQSPRIEYQTPPKFEGAKGSFPTYTVKFEATALGAGEATKVWASKDALRNELARFMQVVADTWGPAGQTIHATFTYDSQQGESSIRIPNKTPTEAAESVISLLDLAD